MAALRSLGSLLAILCTTATILSLICVPVAASSGRGNGGLRNGYYHHTCPNVGNIIFNSIHASYKKDSSVAPGVLRLAYHDCFVRGCDASLLLEGPNTERTHIINGGLHGFEAIDAAKEAVEKACPGVVSCSDVLQYAVRDTVILTGGEGWTVPAGRRDGRVSNAAEVPENLVTPDNKVPELLKAFQKKGLNAAQMVTLAGSHTIGTAPCLSFDNRLHIFDSPSKVDPTLPAHFASSLKKQCPMANLTNTVNLELVTPNKFDTQYSKNIINKMGLLTSDQSMLEDSRTTKHVHVNTATRKFNSNFAKAMIEMSKIEVLTGHSGEIRRQCGFVN